MSNSCGESAWHNTVKVYGAQPEIQPGSGNLIATRGGGSRRKRRSSTKKYVCGGKKRGSRKVLKKAKRKVKRGGSCPCNSGGSDASVPGAAPVSGLMTGPVSA